MVPPSTRLIGWFIGDGFQDEVADVGEFVEAVVQIAQARGLLGIEATFDRRDLFQRAAESEDVARVGRPEGNFGEQAFQIEDARELFAQFGTQNGLLGAVRRRPSRRCSISARSMEGRRRRWRRRRPPMPVRV